MQTNTINKKIKKKNNILNQYKKKKKNIKNLKEQIYLTQITRIKFLV